jgi:hypothetical protein
VRLPGPTVKTLENRELRAGVALEVVHLSIPHDGSVHQEIGDHLSANSAGCIGAEVTDEEHLVRAGAGKRWAIEIVGVDRILLSTDYPFELAPEGGFRRFLKEAELSDIDQEKIAHGNWDRLCAGIRR